MVASSTCDCSMWSCNIQPRAARWFQLALLSILLATLFTWVNLPASFLMGPMVAAIVLAVRGASVRPGRHPFLWAQGVVGCLMGRSLSSSLVGGNSGHWGALVMGVAAVVVLAYLLAWMVSRRGSLAGDATLLGFAPGGASAMVIMADAQGADARMVALMQYLRVVCVSLAATLVAHFWLQDSGPAPTHTGGLATALLLPPTSWLYLLVGLAVAVSTAYLGLWLRIPSGSMLVPMAAFFLLREFAHVPVELHALALTLAYAWIGWTVGMRFDRAVLASCLELLPAIMASILGLIALSAAVGMGLVVWAGVDPLTAYLATSPGGADVVVIIAASSPVDLTFVLSMQVLRGIVVAFTGPLIARYLRSSS